MIFQEDKAQNKSTDEPFKPKGQNIRNESVQMRYHLMTEVIRLKAIYLLSGIHSALLSQGAGARFCLWGTVWPLEVLVHNFIQYLIFNTKMSITYIGIWSLIAMAW